jgi:hypothetical protein
MDLDVNRSYHPTDTNGQDGDQGIWFYLENETEKAIHHAASPFSFSSASNIPIMPFRPLIMAWMRRRDSEVI